jgi:hypothetical protein
VRQVQSPAGETGGGDDPGIVDQDVEPSERGRQFVDDDGGGGERGQVQLAHLRMPPY